MSDTSDPIVIVDAARTPMGGFQGDFANVTAAELGAAAIRAAVARSGVAPELVEEIVRLSLKHGVLSEYTAFLARDGNNYAFHLAEPLDTATLTGSRNDKIHAAALFYTQAVENIIHQYPDQWFWMHNRWKPYNY